MSTADVDVLREMVRQVLREVVPGAMAAAVASAPRAETVGIATDADLQAFARRIAVASDDERAAIAAGSTVFRLAVAPGSAPVSMSARAGATVAAVPQSTSGAVVRIESGPVTERHVRAAAASQSRIVLGRKAVLTPLARDRARAAGVEITRER